MSLFSQDSFIFNGSIKENILFGEKLDSERLKKICEKMNIFEFITYRNLDRLIDPYKNNLSSGQIQRILLARTLYKKSMIYIFDEPTTNLDKLNKKLKESVEKEKVEFEKLSKKSELKSAAIDSYKDQVKRLETEKRQNIEQRDLDRQTFEEDALTVKKQHSEEVA